MKTLLTIPFLALTLVAGCGAPTDDTNSTDDQLADGKEDALRAGKFETFTGKDGRFYFHLLAGNGQKVLQSQGYTSKESALNGVDSVGFNGQHAEAYQLLQAQDGEWYFNLLAGNYQTIATSEMYVSKSNAQRAISSITALLELQASTGAAAPTARFQVFRGLDGQYYFHLRAGNGEIVLQSEGYTRKASALDGTASVSNWGADSSRYTVKDAANGQAYFVVTASNGQVVGVSETYDSRSNAERGAADVLALLTAGNIQAAQ
jgi:uncharacterized protein YegP (UPF0339 family)